MSTVALVVQLTGPAASAASTAPDNVASIFPAHDGGSTDFANDYSSSTQMGVLTNKAPTGAAHLTAVSADPGAEATNGATEMVWFYCDTGFSPVSPHCTTIGASTTPTIAAASSGYTNTSGGDGTIDAAWDLNWNIPANLTGDVFDIVAVGCNGVPDPTLANCTTDTVHDVLLDGGGGPFPQTSSGRIISPANGGVFTQEVATPLTGATSPEITAAAFGLDNAGSGDDDPAGGASGDVDNWYLYEATLVTTSATATAWAAGVPANDVSVGEYALTFFGTNNAGLDSGIVSAPCDAEGRDCTSTAGGLAFDRNYMVAEPGVPGEPDSVQLHRTIDVAADTTCQTGTKSIFAPAGTVVNLTGCVLDAFLSGVGGEPVFWTITNTPDSNGGSFVGSPDLTTTAGAANAAVTAPATAAGSKSVVTFCDDPNSNGSCAGGAGTDTFTISWNAPATHDRSVSLKLKGSLKASGTVSVLGIPAFPACADTVPVKIQRRANGSWHTKKTTTTASDGTYHVKLKNKSGKYRAVAPETSASGEICNKAVSPKKKYKA